MTAKKLKSATFRFAGYVETLAPELSGALAGVSPKVLAGFIAREHPQIGAVVLAHVDAQTAGEALKLLKPEKRPELLERLARLGPVDPLILDDLMEAIEAELAREHEGKAPPPEGGGPAGVAALLQTLDRATADRLLTEIEAREPKVAAAIRELSFRFVDLTRLLPKSLQDLVRETPQASWRIALRGAPAALVEAVLGSMSPRVASQLKDDLASDPKARQADVEAAQRQIAETARRLVDEGRLILADGPDRYV